MYYGVGRVKEDPTSWALVLGKDREESEVLPVAKTSSLRKEQKEHLKRGTGIGMMRYKVGAGFQDRAFTYSSRWAWTDSFDCQLQLA